MKEHRDNRPNRREILLASTALAAGSALAFQPEIAQAQQGVPAPKGPPNIVYFLVDNLGYGELGCYGGGILRGADTKRIDAFATEGMKLLNFAPEAQCTPSRSALMTGRYAVRSGNHTVALPGEEGALVAWERTMGDILSAQGYATACVGKWHIGESTGRWPTDHGFDEWYGPPRTWDESLWPSDPWYDAKRDGRSDMLESRKGDRSPRAVKQLDLDVRRDVDREFLDRSKAFMKRSTAAGKPFFLYFNHSLMHMPTIPRAEFKGKSAQGDWADCLLELDADFGEILDALKDLGAADNTIVVFSGDNGPEELETWRGTAGSSKARISPVWKARCVRLACCDIRAASGPGGKATTLSTSPTCSRPCYGGPVRRSRGTASSTASISASFSKEGVIARSVRDFHIGWVTRSTA